MTTLERFESYDAPITRVGACCGCNRSTLRPDRQGLLHPYKTVRVLRFRTMEIRLCPECVADLKTRLP